jgi:hypothetical protein
MLIAASCFASQNIYETHEGSPIADIQLYHTSTMPIRNVGRSQSDIARNTDSSAACKGTNVASSRPLACSPVRFTGIYFLCLFDSV